MQESTVASSLLTASRKLLPLCTHDRARQPPVCIVIISALHSRLREAPHDGRFRPLSQPCDLLLGQSTRKAPTVDEVIPAGGERDTRRTVGLARLADGVGNPVEWSFPLAPQHPMLASEQYADVGRLTTRHLIGRQDGHRAAVLTHGRKPLPVDVCEEGMLPHLLRVHRTQPTLRVAVQQLADQVTRIGRHMCRECQLLRLDVLEQLLSVVAEVGRCSDEHLVEEHAQAVQVDALAVASLAQHLRGQIGDTPAE
mmetsp:Transcript_10197/g.24687  ORF Transcript_10197/g.24687 Transcript_10197/m.24687 type:complete len:254 (-) Transcript_10197:898-1659(-)